MKNRILLAALLLVSFFCIASAFQSERRAPRWEYKFEYNPSEKKANELGAAGWELAAVQAPGPGIGNNVPTYVFKRLSQ